MNSVMAAADTTTIISVVAAIGAVATGLWKGLPEITKALAERDGIVADTYQQVIGDVRDELDRLKAEAHEAHVALAAARVEIETLREANEKLTVEVGGLRREVAQLEGEVARLKAA